MTTCADCPTPAPVEGSVRLLGGFGSPCDPIHSGYVEVFHLDEWGAICIDEGDADVLTADVVCRQLGFPHGAVVDPTTNPPDLEMGQYSYNYVDVDEAEEPQGRFFLNSAMCRGSEARLVDCDLGDGLSLLGMPAGCSGTPSRLTVACRTFAVSEALEDVTTPGARAPRSSQYCR